MASGGLPARTVPPRRVVDYSTIPQRKDLIVICEQRGLPTYGTREQIVARLQKADAETVPPAKETPVVDVVATEDQGDADLIALAALPTTTPMAPPPQPSAPAAGDMAQIFAAMQAELAAVKAKLAATEAATQVPAGPAEPASSDAIARAAQGERVYRTEFVLLDGVELGEGLHASLIAQTAAQAVAAGYRTRGGARRYGFGTNEQGQRTALYEIYARK